MRFRCTEEKILSMHAPVNTNVRIAVLCDCDQSSTMAIIIGFTYGNVAYINSALVHIHVRTVFHKRCLGTTVTVSKLHDDTVII